MSDPVTPSAATVVALGQGRYLLEDGERRRVAFAARDGRSTWVFVNGLVYVVSDDQRAGEERGAAPDADANPTAPMPATVVAVEVVAGQRVARGDVMVRLEAMKMELPITASRDATVIAVRCTRGEIVQPGVPLVELE